MNSMLGVLARVPLYQSFRAFGWPKMLPINFRIDFTHPTRPPQSVTGLNFTPVDSPPLTAVAAVPNLIMP